MMHRYGLPSSVRAGEESIGRPLARPAVQLRIRFYDGVNVARVLRDLGLKMRDDHPLVAEVAEEGAVVLGYRSRRDAERAKRLVQRCFGDAVASVRVDR